MPKPTVRPTWPLRGKVDKSVSAAHLADYNMTWTNTRCEARFIVRQVIENGADVRTSYILTGIEAEGLQA